MSFSRPRKLAFKHGRKESVFRATNGMPSIQKKNLSNLLRQSFCNRFDQTKLLFMKLDEKRKDLKREFVLKEYSKFGFDFDSGFRKTIFEDGLPSGRGSKDKGHTGANSGKLKRLVRAVKRYKTSPLEEVSVRSGGQIEQDFRKILNELDTGIIRKKSEIKDLAREANLNQRLKKTRSPQFKRLAKLIRGQERKNKNSNNNINSNKNTKKPVTHFQWPISLITVQSSRELINSSNPKPEASISRRRFHTFLSPKSRKDDSSVQQNSFITSLKKRRRKIRKQVKLTNHQIDRAIQMEDFMGQCLAHRLAQITTDVTTLKKKTVCTREYIRVQALNEELSRRKMTEIQVINP